jgi:glycerol-3-phosphate cytidylyltransferase
MKKVITYGTFDLLHLGHIAILNKAKNLGDYLIVAITSDVYDKERGKLNVKQSLSERIEAVKNTGIADKIIVEEYEGQKIFDIIQNNVDIFVVGSDWYGKFEYLKELCEVIYLPRTEGVSSTKLRNENIPVLRLGIIGTSYISEKLYEDSLFVSGIMITCAYDDNLESLEKFCSKYNMVKFTEFSELLKNVDAIYISFRIDKHYQYIMTALSAGCHVLCRSPIFLTVNEAKKAFELARDKQLVLLEESKTSNLPAFERLNLLVRSGLIGCVKSIDVSCSQIPERFDEFSKNKFDGSFYDWGATVMLPIIKLLGTHYDSCQIVNFEDGQYSYMTQGILTYPFATAHFKVGKGIKFEGCLTIVGTDGYVHVPAPWWLTDYFEIRYEDLRRTRRFFYKYEGNGLRYMLLRFIQNITDKLKINEDSYYDEKICIAKIIEVHANNYKKIKMH